MAERKQVGPTPPSKELLDLQELLNKPGQGPYTQLSPDTPPFEVPPMFRKQTDVVGANSEQARIIEKLLTFLPQLRGRIPRITVGYGPQTIADMASQANDPPPNYENVAAAKRMLAQPTVTNTRGRTILKDNSIELNTFPKEFEQTLLHELSHASGNLGENSDFLTGVLNKSAPARYMRSEMAAQDTEKVHDKHKDELNQYSSYFKKKDQK